MARALELAASARGRTSPNPMVGAVIVRDDQVVGEGFHARAGANHAEIAALEQAGGKARGADLYVSLEPCAHFGRTPPCVDSIVRAGVARVFAAMEDPNPQVSGRGFSRLREAGIRVTSGLLGPEARELNAVYCKHVTTGLPHVTLKIGMSLDGRTATRTGESQWITGETSRLRVHELRNQHDAILVGIGTILADDPQLTTRLPGVECRHPVRVVVDSNLRVPRKARVLSRRPRVRTLLVAGPHAPPERIRELRELGAEVIVVEGPRKRVDLRGLMTRLGSMGITSVLVEGGSEVAASCLDAGVVDRILLFVAPIIIGGRGAVPAIGGRGVAALADAWRLGDVRWSASGEDLVLEGRIKGAPCSPA